MHRQAMCIAIATYAGLLLGGCLGDYTVMPSPDPDCPKPPPAEQPPPPPEPFEVYGIRLAPLVQTFDDGTVVIDKGRFYDLERSEACAVVQLAGQPPRCLPPFVRDPAPGYFSNPECTLPIVVLDNCEHLPSYVLVESGDGLACNLPSHLRALAGQFEKDIVYSFAPMGECVGKSASATWPGSLVLTTGGAITLDKFVSVVGVEPGAG